MAASGEKFIRKYGLWTDEQHRQALEIKARVEKEKLKLVRVAWADPHGASRAKTVMASVFPSVLESGYNINVATSTLDAAGGRVFASFTQGGGMGLEEMTGSPNLIIVPDPATFRVLPWEPSVGWILCDEYFTNGAPFHFSTRQLLRKQIDKFAERKLRCVIGLEVEWYLRRLTDAPLTDERLGAPGRKAKAPATLPVEPGFSFHSESNMDLMYGPITALADVYDGLGLPLRSFENEWGPGQLETTFGPKDALETADNLVLFRAATRQVCRRMGYLASFMCRPQGPVISSGWHLHQSLVDAGSGQNAFIPENEGQVLSPLGMSYLGGLMRHGLSSTVFANPTINAYRRFRANSLAPDRVVWGTDHRGAMLRVLGAPNDPASRIENRLGEPSANPYLYIASQMAAGLDGINSKADPGPPETNTYASQRPMLPTSLSQSLELMAGEPLYRQEFGALFMDYYLQLKRAELGRYEAFATDAGIDPASGETTDWEQDEYFDFF
jgi:glutamine synthetase